MAMSSRTVCRKAGCGRSCNGSYCKIHADTKPDRSPDNRLNATERGYDADWRRLRKQYVTDFPLCQDCLEEGRVTPVQEVDHVEAITGLDDPCRLDYNNLRSLCRSHHRRKTMRDRRDSKEHLTPKDI